MARSNRSANVSFVKYPTPTGIAYISHECQLAETGDNLAQKFEFLGRKVACLNRRPGGVAARSRQTRDETAADRVRRHREHDWDD
jgi:hypothetical protein